MAMVRVPNGPWVFGGWKGDLTIEGEFLKVTGATAAQRLVVDVRDLARASFNGNNGVWTLRKRDGEKIYLHTAGRIVSANRGKDAQSDLSAIRSLLTRYSVPGLRT